MSEGTQSGHCRHASCREITRLWGQPCITYGEATALLRNSELILPVFHWKDAATLAAFFPMWAPNALVAEKLRGLHDALQAQEIHLSFVTEVPRERLLADWQEAMPAEGKRCREAM